MPLHFEAWQAALGEHGGSLAEALFYELAGVPTRDIIRTLNDRHGWTVPVEEAAARKRELYLERIDRIRPIEPVVALAQAYAGKLPMAIASGGGRAVVHRTLDALGLTSLFQAIVTADDVPNGKPAPDVFLEAARQLGVDPSRCVAFEDGELGLQSARAAGMHAIDVRPWCPAPGA